MTQFLLSVHHSPDEPVPTEESEMQRLIDAVDAFNAEAQEAGIWLFAGGLESVDAATTVDARGAEPVITDGPFAESKEWLGGFWVFELPDLDAALSWAVKGSKACAGKVEVRPFQGEG